MRRLSDRPALLVIVPIIEIAVLIAVGQVIGAGLDAPAGARHVGARRLAAAARGRPRPGGRSRPTWPRAGRPGNTATDGLLVLVGGIFMLVPGFVSDVIGALLIAPPTRESGPRGRACAGRSAPHACRGDLPVRSAPGPGPVRQPRNSPRPIPSDRGRAGPAIEGEIIDPR